MQAAATGALIDDAAWSVAARTAVALADAKLARRFDAGAPADRLIALRARAVDVQVRAAWQRCFDETAPLALFAVGGGELQLVTSCHQFTALLGKAAFELVPVLAGNEGIGLLRQHLNDIHHGKPPGVRRLVIQPTDGVAVELGGQDFHRSPLQQMRRSVTPGAACTCAPTSKPCPSNATL